MIVGVARQQLGCVQSPGAGEQKASTCAERAHGTDVVAAAVLQNQVRLCKVKSQGQITRTSCHNTPHLSSTGVADPSARSPATLCRLRRCLNRPPILALKGKREGHNYKHFLLCIHSCSGPRTLPRDSRACAGREGRTENRCGSANTVLRDAGRSRPSAILAPARTVAKINRALTIVVI